MPRSILVLYAHPRTERSQANIRLRRVAEGLNGVTVVDLYGEYPTYEIDVDREQARLAEHDVIVFQHPVYWYSAPALLKEWIDLVLEWRWAYGPDGTALQNKLWLNAVTAGGNQAAYGPAGRNRLDLRALFAPFEQTALLCGMRFLPPFALFDANDRRDRAILDAHAAGYAKLLRALRDDTVDMAAVSDLRGLAETYCPPAEKEELRHGSSRRHFPLSDGRGDCGSDCAAHRTWLRARLFDRGRYPRANHPRDFQRG